MPDVNETNEERQLRWGRIQEEVHAEVDRERWQKELEGKLREARRQQRELEQRYPYMDGGRTVLGPGISVRGGVLTWKDVDYVPQEQVRALRDLRSVCGIHLQAMAELMHDAGVRFPDNALRLYLLLVDELTLTLPALAENHPAVLPRLPEGME